MQKEIRKHLGAPGSQKVDIAKRIAQKYEGFEIISMGALLRSNAAAQSNDELWQRIARKIEQGEPVPMVNFLPLSGVLVTNPIVKKFKIK